MKKILLCAAMAMLALVGCEKQQNSELNFDDVKGKAVVTGKLVGYVNAPGEATVKQALAGIRVYVQVPNSEYRKGAEGNSLFESKTDEEGNYSIEVKLGTKGIAANQAKLRWDDFHIEIGGKNVYFQFGEKNLPALNDGDYREDEFMVDQDAVLNSTNGEIKAVKGRVTYDAGAYQKEDGSWVEKGNIQTKSGVKVIASVTYFKGQKGQEVVRSFIVNTDANGEFEFSAANKNAIPVQADGNLVALSFEQFEGVRKVYNDITGKYDRDSVIFFKLSAPDTIVPAAPYCLANETYIKELQADDEQKAETPVKDAITFVVKGKVYQQADEAIKNSDNTTIGWFCGKKLTTMKVSVRVKHVVSGTEVDAIQYDNIAPNAETGEYSQKVAVFEDWKLSDIVVDVFATETKKVAGGADNADKGAYQHHHFTAKDDYTFPTKAEDMSSQYLGGIYKGGKDNVAATAKVSDDQKFFDLKMPNAIIPFSPEDSTEIRGMDAWTAKGVGAADLTHTEKIYLGSKNESSAKYFDKKDIREVDIKKDGDKTYLYYNGGIPYKK